MSKRSSPGSSAFVFDPEAVLRQASRGGPSDDLVEAARAQAEAILQAAKAEAAAVLQQAREQGRQQGAAQAFDAWQAAVERMSAEKARFTDELEKQMAGVEAQMLELALDVAARIVRHEINKDSEVVLRTLQAALAQIRDRSSLTIRVNLSDLELVRSSKGDIASWLDSVKDVEIIDDRRVEKGGAVIDSGDGTLDARPSSQVSEIRRKLLDSADEK